MNIEMNRRGLLRLLAALGAGAALPKGSALAEEIVPPEPLPCMAARPGLWRALIDGIAYTFEEPAVGTFAGWKVAEAWLERDGGSPDALHLDLVCAEGALVLPRIGRCYALELPCGRITDVISGRLIQWSVAVPSDEDEELLAKAEVEVEWEGLQG